MGGDGADFIEGSSGRNRIDGGAGSDELLSGTGADVFVFSAGNDHDDIIGFSEAQGDRLELDDAIWTSTAGTLSAAQVLAQFGSVNAAGNLELDFGGGDVIELRGVTTISDSSIDIV